MGGLGRREAVLLAEGFDESLRAGVLQRPVPVGGAVDTLDVFSGALGHQPRIKRHNDLEVLAVHALVAQAELNRLGQGIDHVLAVVIQDQHVGAGIEHRRDILRKVAGAQGRANRVDGLPAQRFGGVLDGLFLGPAPGVVGGQVVGAAVVAHFPFQHRPQRRAGHVGIEEVAEAIAALVFSRGVIGVGQAGHEDDAHLLRQRLLGNRHARGRPAGEHQHAVLFDHPLGRGAGRIGLGLRVAGDVVGLLAQDALAVQTQRLEGVQHAAVALAVDVLDGQPVGAKLIGALVGVGPGLRHVEAEGHGRLIGRVIAKRPRPTIAGENLRHGHSD